MKTATDIRIIALGLDDKGVREGLRRLSQDPNFPAVVAWLDRNRQSWEIEASKQSLAGNHGQLAHAAGSLHALIMLEGQLLTALARTPKAQGGVMSGE